MISHLSNLFELALGGLIYMGTPSGVGPAVKGDLQRGGVEDVGEIEVSVVEPAFRKESITGRRIETAGVALEASDEGDARVIAEMGTDGSDADEETRTGEAGRRSPYDIQKAEQIAHERAAEFERVWESGVWNRERK